MEPLRHLIDRIVISLIHLKEITESDFYYSKNGNRPTCRLNGEAFRKFIHKYEKTMETEFQYQKGEKMTYNTYIDRMIDEYIISLKLSTKYKTLKIN